MRRAVVVGCALVSLVACKSEKWRNTDAELTAAKARVAALDQRRGDLVKDLARLQTEHRTLAKQGDEAELARTRLNAALGVFDGLGVPDGLLLDEALRTKSPGLGRLAADIVQRRLPCIPAEEDDDGSRSGPDCDAEPFVDACEDVPERTVQNLQWHCPTLVKQPGSPSLAVCLAPLDETMHALVRLAFVNEGRLFVGDWPQPSRDLYQPPNTAELAMCGAANDLWKCERACDERFNRVSSHCYEDEGAMGSWYDDEEENTESPELRDARIAAAEAAEAARVTADELAYQECRAPCQLPEEEAEREAGPRDVKFKDVIAPGVYRFSLAGTEDAGVAPREWVLSFDAVNLALADNLATDNEDDVWPLKQLLDTERVVVSEPRDGTRRIAGVVRGVPTGARISVDGKVAPVDLKKEEVCELAKEMSDVALLTVCGGAP